MATPDAKIDRAALRKQMVQEQLIGRCIRDPGLIEAMQSIPREAFLPVHLAGSAYADVSLQIEPGRVMPRPYLVALVIQALELVGTENVLEIGTGAGYSAAILGRLARRVFTIERCLATARAARRRLKELGVDNVHVEHGDGELGFGEHAPYDAIAVGAASPVVPRRLVEQLGDEGRLVMALGHPSEAQALIRLRRKGGQRFAMEQLSSVQLQSLSRI